MRGGRNGEHRAGFARRCEPAEPAQPTNRGAGGCVWSSAAGAAEQAVPADNAGEGAGAGGAAVFSVGR